MFRRSRKRDSFEQVVAFYGGPLLRFVARLTGDPSGAEDLVQDDFDGDDDEDGDFEDIGYDDRGTHGDVYPFPGSSYDDSDDPEEPENGVEDDEEIYYEAECPGCGEIIEFDDETLEKGAIRCPGCGAMLRFDLDEPENPGEDAAADEAVDGPPEEDLPEE